MPIDYATAGELLETFGRAWQTFDGDLIVSMFTDDAEYHADLFGPPMVGHNAIRAYWLDGADTTEQVEFTVERHWVVGRHGAGRVACQLLETRRRARGCGSPGS